MTTAKQIYDAALILIDANNDADTSEYLSKALGILNVLRGEVYPYSWEYDPEQPNSPAISTMDSTVEKIDDFLCQSVLPYGLGAHLLLDENPSTAGYLNQRYEELLAARKRGIGHPVFGTEDIVEVEGYGHINTFTRW